ncbi:exopolysaccharide biosynthesis protein [Paenibacillus sp. FSL R7-0273]|uniref:phosphodiester glycosidase family protein n=1 Tax=Paenibacillus sp. FSL R7-0273 TaxID=1536772 RepID=UPI0004F64F08|nr:phosphodiester glycosidase family protein [Paenibacillus sp. FSL R7-0273]AIQ47105.1 exopolysaccharide biosynthesis protein [Paenibacillus sp. FSL R7-0273]OMF97142.1 exopolysaccharide biosynthesis protein [Paenibacillus sp. FSL R7-0273]
MSTSASPRRQGAQKKKAVKKKRRKVSFLRKLARGFMFCLLLLTIGMGWLYFAPSALNFRYLIADTLITTQHRYMAKYIIGEEELKNRVAEYNQRFIHMGDEVDTHTITAPVTEAAAEAAEVKDEKPLVEIEQVSGSGYSGYVMTVNDPTKVRLGIPDKAGSGEKVSSMVARTGAIAGVNGGGFADPEWKGNGFKPIGLVISQGKLFYNGLGGKTSTQIVGIDKQGKMIAGNYSLEELGKLGVQEAVSFQPRIIVNGKGLIKNAAEGWGIAPRTAMGQRADGALLFVVIDGRQPGYSIGANLYDVQQIMLKHGAVIAANLDGGSSTVLVKDNEIVNKPSSQYGERYLPTAFLVFEHPEQVKIDNIWEGLDPSQIDAAKKRPR